MTIQECYEKLGGNYSEALGRMIRPELVEKFLAGFLKDDSYEMLCREVSAGNREEAFRAAHTLKGVCLNLGLGTLAASASKITEVLRPKTEVISGEAAVLLEEVRKDYQAAEEAIRAYLESR